MATPVRSSREWKSSVDMDPAQGAAEPDDRGTRLEQLGDEDIKNLDTLTGLFNGVAKDRPAIIIPEGDERSVSYAQLYENVMSFQRDLAGQWTSAYLIMPFSRTFALFIVRSLRRRCSPHASTDIRGVSPL